MTAYKYAVAVLAGALYANIANTVSDKYALELTMTQIQAQNSYTTYNNNSYDPNYKSSFGGQKYITEFENEYQYYSTSGHNPEYEHLEYPTNGSAGPFVSEYEVPYYGYDNAYRSDYGNDTNYGVRNGKYTRPNQIHFFF